MLAYIHKISQSLIKAQYSKVTLLSMWHIPYSTSTLFITKLPPHLILALILGAKYSQWKNVSTLE